jgi:hypothetical protein
MDVVVNRRLIDTVFSGKRSLAYSARCIAPSYFDDLLIAQLTTIVSFAVSYATFPVPVENVVLMRSKKQVIRVYTARVIALVQHP